MVQHDHSFLPEHYLFFEFVNKLTFNRMFQGFKKDSLLPIPDDAVLTSAYCHDGVKDCCSLYTDGSLQKDICGFGSFVDDYFARPSRLIKCFRPVNGKRTNNAAELTAIIKGISF
eukprot:Mrub_02248.p3 GENE.Mrub_02248~~Mrub_02248.p3  ORF type:complete len:115 (-),score=17.03 Mrub_02248:304-648(-)